MLCRLSGHRRAADDRVPGAARKVRRRFLLRTAISSRLAGISVWAKTLESSLSVANKRRVGGWNWDAMTLRSSLMNSSVSVD